MSIAQQKQRLLAVLFLLAVLVVLILGLVAFEISQHINALWPLIHSISVASVNLVSHHP